jgi:hypothetical protein
MALVLRRMSDLYPQSSWGADHYAVLSHNLLVGRVYRVTGGPQEGHWFWSISGIHAGPEVMTASNVVATLDLAKAQVAANWRKWLTWAGLQEIELPNVSQAMPGGRDA